MVYAKSRKRPDGNVDQGWHLRRVRLRALPRLLLRLLRSLLHILDARQSKTEPQVLNGHNVWIYDKNNAVNDD